MANHFLRNQLGLPSTSTTVDGPGAYLKQALARGVRLFNKMTKKEKEQYVYPKTFVVDPTAPNGLRFLENGESFVAPHEQLVE